MNLFLQLILLLFTSILFSQTQVINSWEDWNFIGTSKPIPTIAANLKPERQPSWTDQSFINLVDELKIPSLRWPGAVGSNYFDWHKGTILPCYKFNHSIGSCFDDIYCKDALASGVPGGCIAKELQIELLNSDANADGNISIADNINDNSIYDINYSAFEAYGPGTANINEQGGPVSDADWNLFQDYDVLIPGSNPSSDINNFPILISSNGGFLKGRNKNSNLAQDYVNAMNFHSDFKPFFVLNVYNPEYIDAEEAFGSSGWDTNQDCVYDASENNGNFPNIYNSIVDQLDKICELNINSEFYIQLGNEVWHLFEYDENTFPCARAYAERMIEVAKIIRGLHDLSNPDWGGCFSNAKIALFADAHAPDLQGDYCEGESIPGDYDPNEWNDFLGSTLEDMSSYTDEISCLSNGGLWDNLVCYKTWSCNVDWNPENINSIPNSHVSEEKRCEWNEALARVLQNYGATDLFDAVSIHKYYGAANMSIPCFGEWSYWDEGEDITGSQSITIDVNDLDLDVCGASGYGGWNDAHDIGLNDDLPWGWAFDLYGSNQNLRDSNSPTLTDYYKLDYMVKWLTVNVDISLDYWDGSSDSPTASDGLYNNLIPNNDYEIWITEYDIEPSDKKWVGTWPHALSFLYRTLRYIEDIPNVALLSPNNLYGFWGPYQLLDSYSVDRDNNDGISCYVSHDFSTSCVKEYCDNVFINLSPKGEVLKVFNELVHDRGNTTVEKIIFDTTKVPEIYIERASALILDMETQITFKTQDIHGWKFDPRDDYIFMNLSPRQYTIDFGVNNSDDACYYSTRTISSENLFAKNYYNPNPSVNLGSLEDVSQQGIDSSRPNEYVLWEFDEDLGVPIDLDPYYAATSSLSQSLGSTDSQLQILVPPYSVIQVISSCDQGAFYPGDINADGIINILDIISVVNHIVFNTSFTDMQFELADLNYDGSIDVVDITAIVNIIIE